MFVFLTPCILSKQSCLLIVIPVPLKIAAYNSKLFSCVVNMELCVRHFPSPGDVFAHHGYNDCQCFCSHLFVRLSIHLVIIYSTDIY